MIADEHPLPSLSARLARWLAHFAFLLAVAALVGHRFLGLETPAFVVVGLLVPAIGLVAIGLAAIAIRRFWVDDVPGAGMSIWAIVLSASLFVPYGWAAVQAWQMPMIHDLATDTRDPPQLRQAVLERSGRFMNPIRAFAAPERALIDAAYPDIRGRRYDRASQDVEAKVSELLAERGWRRYPPASVPGDWPETTFEARAVTPLMGFPADVAIRVIDEGESTFVDMRSSAVYGRHDLGDNARRIRRFLDELDRLVNEIVLPAAPVEEEPAEGGE